MSDALLKEARAITEGHYENFPVSPFFISRKLRTQLYLIYQFARTADDLADEGELNDIQRLKSLKSFEAAFSHQSTPFMKRLHSMTRQYQLSTQHFYDLLSAFRQDVVKRRYATIQELFAYCAHSANPVGRLMLELLDMHDPTLLEASDALCTALQLLNFWQDLGEDITTRNRLYLPLDVLATHNVDVDTLFLRINSPELQQCLESEYQRIEALLALARHLYCVPGRSGFHLRVIHRGAYGILKKMRRRLNPYYRPRLTTWDWCKIALSTLCTYVKRPS